MMTPHEITSLRTALRFLARGDTRPNRIRLGLILGAQALGWALLLTALVFLGLTLAS